MIISLLGLENIRGTVFFKKIWLFYVLISVSFKYLKECTDCLIYAGKFYDRMIANCLDKCDAVVVFKIDR